MLKRSTLKKHFIKTMKHREIIVKAKISSVEWAVGVPQFHFDGEKCEVNSIHRLRQAREDEVNPETVCQYIGLNDKDNARIFENDVLVLKYSEDDVTKWVVYFNKVIGRYRMKMLEGNGERDIYPLNEKATIIGNVLDL